MRPKTPLPSQRPVFSGDDGVGLVSENVVSELPCDSDDGKIIHMGRHSIPSQTGDLFSVGRSSPEQQISEPEAAPLPRRVASPKTCPGPCVIWTTEYSTCCCKRQSTSLRRRGRSPVNRDAVPTATDAGLPRKKASPVKRTRYQNIKGAAGLTQGRVNAVRAAFKAGITPARITRQFGLSLADVRKALSSDEPRR